MFLGSIFQVWLLIITFNVKTSVIGETICHVRQAPLYQTSVECKFDNNVHSLSIEYFIVEDKKKHPSILLSCDWPEDPKHQTTNCPINHGTNISIDKGEENCTIVKFYYNNTKIKTKAANIQCCTSVSEKDTVNWPCEFDEKYDYLQDGNAISSHDTSPSTNTTYNNGNGTTDDNPDETKEQHLWIIPLVIIFFSTVSIIIIVWFIRRSKLKKHPTSSGCFQSILRFLKCKLKEGIDEISSQKALNPRTSSVEI